MGSKRQVERLGEVIQDIVKKHNNLVSSHNMLVDRLVLMEEVFKYLKTKGVLNADDIKIIESTSQARIEKMRFRSENRPKVEDNKPDGNAGVSGPESSGGNSQEPVAPPANAEANKGPDLRVIGEQGSSSPTPDSEHPKG